MNKRYILSLALLICIWFAAGCTKSATTTLDQSTNVTAEPSDRDLIYQYVQSDRDMWYSSYKLEYWFIMKELETPLDQYHAKLYRCRWELEIIDDEGGTTFTGRIELLFIIKNKIVYPMQAPDSRIDIDEERIIFHETDFDHDGQDELVFYFIRDYGEYIYLYFVVEFDERAPVYSALCSLTGTIGDEEERILSLAIVRFNRYLQERPAMKFRFPEYSISKKTYHEKEYWSVEVKLKERPYRNRFYEIQISPDGEKVALATG